MRTAHQLLTDHIDIWTAADTEKRSGRGRASSNAASVYGVKKLRELILELAVRGKLVAQDKNDVPASDLLKRIKIEKAKLIAAGKIKNDKEFSPISETELLYITPNGWEWTCLYSLTLLITDGTHQTPKYQDDGVPFISVKDIDGCTVSFDDCKYLSKEEHEQINARCNPERDDILICRIGTLGRPTIVDTDKSFSLFVSVGLLKVPKSVKFSRYLHLALSSPLMYSQYDQIKVGGSHTNKLNLADIPRLSVPIPPLKEQHRIVAKVDELMTLCDQLEARHTNASDAHGKLVSHLLSTLTQSQSAEEFSLNWERIAAHFDTLFTTKDSIDVLKQTLLQLAVMGKLVPQDSVEELASALIKRIRDEKFSLIARGEIKKDKPQILITDQEKPFELPKSWTWVRLGELVKSSGAGWSPNCETHPRIGNDWGVLKVSAVSWGVFLPEENKALPKTLEPRLDSLVEDGDFLVSRANTSELVARSVVVEECPPKLMLSDKIVRLRLTSLCNSRFINIANSSSYARQYYSLIAGGTSSSMKNVTREQILNLLIPLPPIKEQCRIVAKVDELMTLCARVEDKIVDAHQLGRRLADVFVEQTICSRK